MDIRKFSALVVLAFATRACLAQAAPQPHALVAGNGHYEIARYLNIRSAAAPSYSPVGDDIAYLTNVTGVSQVWKSPAHGGWPEQLTFFEDRVQRVAWSPRGDALLFAKDQGGDERSQLYLIDTAGEQVEALTNEPKVIHEFGGFSRDGTWICYSSNQRDERYFDVYIMELATHRTRRLLAGDDAYYAISFSPDGRYVLATRVHSETDNDLFLIDVQSAQATYLTPHNGEAFYRSTAWMPDSSGFYLAANQDRDKSNLAFYDLKSRRLTYLENSPYDLDDTTEIAIDNAGHYLFYAWNQDGVSMLRIRDLKTGQAQIFHGLPPGVVGKGSFNADGDRVAFSYSSPTINGDIWIYDLKANRASQVTHSTRAGIPEASFVAAQLITYTSFDNRRIPAFYYLPKNAGSEKLPAIVIFHGGPESEERTAFSPVYQYFLNRGYVVLAPNVRGSSGFGKQYIQMDDHKKRQDAILDGVAAAEFLKTQGNVNPRKIAVMGASYGGFMTLAEATMHPELWAAAVDLFGISNWSTYFKNTGPWRRANRAAEYGGPEKDPEFMASISPINYAEHIQAPLFVVAGLNDPRVPKTEADQIVEKTKAKVPVEYLVFPDEGHGLAKRANRIKAYTAIADFLDRYVKNAK